MVDILALQPDVNHVIAAVVCVKTRACLLNCLFCIYKRIYCPWRWKITQEKHKWLGYCGDSTSSCEQTILEIMHRPTAVTTPSNITAVITVRLREWGRCFRCLTVLCDVVTGHSAAVCTAGKRHLVKRRVLIPTPER